MSLFLSNYVYWFFSCLSCVRACMFCQSITLKIIFFVWISLFNIIIIIFFCIVIVLLNISTHNNKCHTCNNISYYIYIVSHVRMESGKERLKKAHFWNRLVDKMILLNRLVREGKMPQAKKKFIPIRRMFTADNENVTKKNVYEYSNGYDRIFNESST